MLNVWKRKTKKNKEECGSAENESDPNSTTTPQTIISGNKSGRPIASIGSDIVMDRNRTQRRSVTSVPPCLQRQPNIGNVFATTSRFDASGSSSSSPPSSRIQKVQRQGSQGSTFEQFTSQAKELIRETSKQNSQDGLLTQLDNNDSQDLMKEQLAIIPKIK